MRFINEITAGILPKFLIRVEQIHLLRVGLNNLQFEGFRIKKFFMFEMIFFIQAE